LQRSLAGRRVKALQVAADEVNVLHFLKVLADVDRIAEDLSIQPSCANK
jgi:hypothetical protein